MKSAILSSICLAYFALATSAYTIYRGDVVNCHSSPDTYGSIVKIYKENDDVQLTCQTAGEVVKGISLWDKTTDGCFVTDYHVLTGSPGYVAAECIASSFGQS